MFLELAIHFLGRGKEKKKLELCVCVCEFFFSGF
jgi:hypothetical protein